MTINELKENALSLPLLPGVYIMRDKANRVIYVGKAKKLRNRVSQYFQDTASHSVKTRLMVSKVDHFDVIVAGSEFEALILECSLIKQHLPKYNILLKDDKGYPYLRLDMNEDYPVITVANKIANDGAGYYGPFGSRGTTNNVLKTILSALKLPSCGKKFPRDIGKDRVCLNYHMNQCSGWCQSVNSPDSYREIMEHARQLLLGNYKDVLETIKQKMLSAADDLNFELAAELRNQMYAIESLGKKQLVTACSMSDIDVIGYGETETTACFALLHFRDGCLLDKDYELFSVPQNPEMAVSSLMKQYYLSKGYAPRLVLLPFYIGDSSLFSQMLEQYHHVRTAFVVPRRGEKAQMVSLAIRNAREEAERVTQIEERTNATILLLKKMLDIPAIHRIESYDISNVSGTDIVAGMVVFQDGKQKRSEYRRFKIKYVLGQDDYQSMYETIYRRFKKGLAKEKGFDTLPDLLLIDGGVVHAQTAVRALKEIGLDLPVFGMVKDDRHRTRALVSPHGQEIRIDNNQSIFAFIGSIQEETHRFAITYHKKLRSKRLKYSQLDEITGIGATRKQMLLRVFKSLNGIANARLFELEQYLPKGVAKSVYDYFNEDDNGGSDKCE